MILRGKKALVWLPTVVACAGLCVFLAIYYLHRSSAERLPRSAAIAKPPLPFASSGSPTQVPTLHIDAPVQHGHIVEIRGSTDPGATVMINGQTASTMLDGNSFHHFLGPLPSGTTIISITSQDEAGGVNTQQMAVTIE